MAVNHSIISSKVLIYFNECNLGLEGKIPVSNCTSSAFILLIQINKTTQDDGEARRRSFNSGFLFPEENSCSKRPCSAEIQKRNATSLHNQGSSTSRQLGEKNKPQNQKTIQWMKAWERLLFFFWQNLSSILQCEKTFCLHMSYTTSLWKKSAGSYIKASVHESLCFPHTSDGSIMTGTRSSDT